jgi:ABC-type phosphate transport system ATPase subunit
MTCLAFFGLSTAASQCVTLSLENHERLEYVKLSVSTVIFGPAGCGKTPIYLRCCENVMKLFSSMLEKRHAKAAGILVEELLSTAFAKRKDNHSKFPHCSSAFI